MIPPAHLMLNEVARAACTDPHHSSPNAVNVGPLLLIMGPRQISCAVFKDSSAPQDPTTSKPYYNRIAEHFEQAGNLEEAERHFVKAGMAHQVSCQDFIRQPEACCAPLHEGIRQGCCMVGGCRHCAASEHSQPAALQRAW